MTEGIDLNLIDMGANGIVMRKINETIRCEIAHADGSKNLVLVEALHRAPGAVNVTHRLVNQIKVEVIETEQVERAVNGSARTFFACILHPKLGCDEKFSTIQPASLDGVTDGSFIAVRSGGVNGTVSGSNRIFYGFLAFLEVANLVHTENGGRHQYAVGKRDVWNPRHLFSPKAADRRTSDSAAEVFPMPIILGQEMGTQLRLNKPIFCLFLPRRC